MTALSEKLRSTGVDTFEAKFYTVAIDALRRHPNSVVDAWWEIGASFGYEYLRERMKDMEPNKERSPVNAFQKSPIATSLRPPRQMKRVDRAKVEETKRKIVEILFGYKVHDGRDLADVGAHELPKMVRDGKLADELKKELPELVGNMRFANLREILTAKQVKAARERAGCA